MWVQTATGLRFDFVEPKTIQVSPYDILGSLPFIPCFTGGQQYLRHEFAYSVAQHSLLVSWILDGTPLALCGLLHDSWKIYTSDLTKPLNLVINRISDDEWSKLRCVWQSVVAKRFRTPYPLPDAVEEADLVARATEARDILAPPPEPWQLVKLPQPLAELIIPLHPTIVREQFEARWTALDPTWSAPHRGYEFSPTGRRRIQKRRVALAR